MDSTIGNRTLRIVNDECCENPWDDECRLFEVFNWHRRKTFCEDETHSNEICVSDEVLRVPLYIYEHGGVAYSAKPFGCPWDSGQCGVLVITKSRLKKMGCEDWDEERLLRDTEGWIKTFQQWANGDVYGYELLVDGEVVDSCFGFYGDDPKKNGMLDYLGKENLDLVEALK